MGNDTSPQNENLNSDNTKPVLTDKNTKKSKLAFLYHKKWWVIIFAWFLVNKSYFTVDEGEVGIALRSGAVSYIANPGLGFKIPFIDSVHYINLQNQSKSYEKLLAYSADQQVAELTVSVNYHLPQQDALEIYKKYGGQEGLIHKILTPQVKDCVKQVFGQYTAVLSIQKRETLVQNIEQSIKDKVKGPLVVESVQLENIDFSDAYEQAIEDRMRAEVEVKKIEQNAQREKVQAEIKVIQSQAEADSLLKKATAEAKSIEMKGKAEAYAIKVRAEALKENQALVNLITAEKWNGQLPQTFIPNSSTPFVKIPAK